MKRRRFVLSAFATPALAAESRRKLLLPSDIPDELGFRIMWSNPVPAPDVSKWQLEVKGLVAKPQSFGLDQLRALPQESQSARMKCVQCWSARTTWSGFRFAALLDLVEPLKTAKAIRLDCADRWYEHMTLQEMANPRVMMVLDMAGQPLTALHGAPLRLLDPSKYGYKSAKIITTITFLEEGKGSMACDVGGPFYSATGEIQAGYDTPLDLMSKEARQSRILDPKVRRPIKGGEITEY
ncbi:MAG TPA: molybdopterin-dependent oxidoreductase [Bryobacteraceae bacterium]|nr:molybdopterin-dependent oxidoreductase [Bryobacteraceae bacterium]